MQASTEDNQGRLVLVAEKLARRAVAGGVDGSLSRPQTGQARWSMTSALPAARVLLGADDSQAWADVRRSLVTLQDAACGCAAGQMPAMTDGFGHTRDVYYPLTLHLFALCCGMSEHCEPSDVEILASAAAVLDGFQDEMNHPPATGEVAAVLWRSLVRAEMGRLCDDAYASASALGTMHRIANEPGDNGALHRLGLDDLLDAWTYRELAGLAALYAAGAGMGDLSMLARCVQVAGFHVGHTQPDYTTYQPWGLAAFAYDDATQMFADQQLHDVATHLSIEGPSGGLLAGLLLAESWAWMSGRLDRVWLNPPGTPAD